MHISDKTTTPPTLRTVQLVLYAVLAAGLWAMVGCRTTQDYYRDVGAAREAAYDTWAAARPGKSDDTQPDISGDLSLADAVKVAVANNKALAAILQEKAVARGQVVEAYSNALPSVDATADYTRLDMVSSFDTGGGTISLGDEDNYSLGLSLKQPLYRGGAIGAALNAAQLYTALTDERVRGAVQDVVFLVARNYFDVLLARHLYEVERDAVESVRGQLEDVKRKRVQGVASDFDVLRAQVALSNFRALMIRRQNAVHLAMTALFRAMGVSQESDVTLADRLGYTLVRMDLDEAVRIAYLNRPDLYEAEFNVRLQEEAVRIARSAYWPEVNARFDNAWTRPDPHDSTIEWGHAWTAGVTGVWHLFDGLAREGRVMQEEAKLRQARIKLADAQEQALQEIQNALLSLQDADEFVQSQKLSMEQATEGLRLAEVGYREGINTAVDLLDARAALTRAQGFYYEALFGHTTVRLALRKAMGTLGPRAGAILKPGQDFNIQQDASGTVGPGTNEEGSSETPTDVPEENLGERQ